MTARAHRVKCLGIRRFNGFYSDIVDPPGGKIIRILEAITDAETEVREKDFLGIVRKQNATRLVGPVFFGIDTEHVKMVVFPSHGQLNDDVQIAQIGVACDFQAAPDHWADFA